MKDPLGLLTPSIPVSYLQLLLEITTERGVSQDQLLSAVSFDPVLLGQPEAHMTPVQWLMLTSRALQLTGDPGLGYEYGLRMRPTSHGFLGYATLSASTLREALEIALRYFEARQRHFTLRLETFPLETQGSHVALELREKYHIPDFAPGLETLGRHVSPELLEQYNIHQQRRFFCENILIGIARSAAACLGLEPAQLTDVEIWFDWPEPHYHAAYRECLPMVRFSRPSNLLRFPEYLMDRQPVLADPFASRQAVERCERELAQAGGVIEDFTVRVLSELLLAASGGYPSQAEVAASLHMSTRTLARKLHAHGTSFQQLLDDARQRDAHDLIERGELDLQDIATRLGYRDPANFTRAFRKWTGKTPSSYRSGLQLESR